MRDSTTIGRVRHQRRDGEVGNAIRQRYARRFRLVGNGCARARVAYTRVFRRPTAAVRRRRRRMTLSFFSTGDSLGGVRSIPYIYIYIRCVLPFASSFIPARSSAASLCIIYASLSHPLDTDHPYKWRSIAGPAATRIFRAGYDDYVS